MRRDQNLETWRAVEQLSATLAQCGDHAAEAVRLVELLKIQLDQLVGPPPAPSLDLWTFARGAMLRAAQTAAVRELDVVPIVDPTLPHHLELDIPLLREAVEVLVAQAISCTESGHVALRLSPQNGPDGLRLQVAVEDTRPPTAEQLGSRQALEQLRPRLAHLDSVLEITRPTAGGCQATFDLPARGLPAVAKPGALAGRRVLLIDDHPVRRQGARAVLESEGAQVQITADPRAGLRIAQASHPDAVLLDVGLHGGAGLALLRRLRRRFSGPIVCIGPDARELAEEARECGADAWRCRPLGLELADATAAALDRRRSALSQTHPTPAPSYDSPRVLVVESDPLACRAARALMTRLRCRVDVAVNGTSALERLRDTPYDLVFMTCQMPGMTGFETVRRLRMTRWPQATRVPVIGMTDPTYGRDGARALEAGMNDYLAKPLDPAVVAAAFSRWTRRASTISDGPSGIQADVHKAAQTARTPPEQPLSVPEAG